LEDCHVAKLGLAEASPQLACLAMTALWPAPSPELKVSWYFFSKKYGLPGCSRGKRLEDCHVAKLGLAEASPQLACLAMTALWPAPSPELKVSWYSQVRRAFRAPNFFKEVRFTDLFPEGNRRGAPKQLFRIYWSMRIPAGRGGPGGGL
ncbi:MAG: hypothetical protein IJP07_01795, partial [Firmicutes bacterium]|nr:hypothetical protein [Bacillota bacterium]